VDFQNTTYRLLYDVVENISGATSQNYTLQKIRLKIGLTGTWINYVFYSRLRSMA